MCVFPVIWCSQLTASKSRDDHVPACQKLVGWNPAVLTMVAPRPSGPVVGCFGIVSLFTVHSFRVQTRSTISPLIECESSLSQQTQARECGCVALIYHAFSNPSRYIRQQNFREQMKMDCYFGALVYCTGWAINGVSLQFLLLTSERIYIIE